MIKSIIQLQADNGTFVIGDRIRVLTIQGEYIAILDDIKEYIIVLKFEVDGYKEPIFVKDIVKLRYAEKNESFDNKFEF